MNYRTLGKSGLRVSEVGLGAEHLQGLPAEQVFAVVRSATRKGKCQKPGCFWWDFFAHVWTHLLPLRHRLQRVYQILSFRRRTHT